MSPKGYNIFYKRRHRMKGGEGVQPPEVGTLIDGTKWSQWARPHPQWVTGGHASVCNLKCIPTLGGWKRAAK